MYFTFVLLPQQFKVSLCKRKSVSYRYSSPYMHLLYSSLYTVQFSLFGLCGVTPKYIYMPDHVKIIYLQTVLNNLNSLNSFLWKPIYKYSVFVYFQRVMVLCNSCFSVIIKKIIEFWFPWQKYFWMCICIHYVLQIMYTYLFIHDT